MSRRSDAVQSLTLIFGSAFAAVFVTSVAMLATERPMATEQSVALPSPSITMPTVVVKPMTVTGYTIGRVEPGKSGMLPIRYRLDGYDKPVVFMNGVRMEGSIKEALEGIDPGDITFVDLLEPKGANPRTIRFSTTFRSKQDGNDG